MSGAVRIGECPQHAASGAGQNVDAIGSGGADHEIGDAVPVDIAEAGHRFTEVRAGLRCGLGYLQHGHFESWRCAEECLESDRARERTTERTI